MEIYKISKLLSNSAVSKFVTKIWIEVNDLLGGQYSVHKNIGLNTPVQRSDLCDYSDAYIVVKERISVAGTNKAMTRNKMPTIKNNVPFMTCITRINSTFIDDAEDLDIVVLMHNLFEYSDNYSMASASLWNHYRDEGNDHNTAGSYRINNRKRKQVYALSIRQK